MGGRKSKNKGNAFENYCKQAIQNMVNDEVILCRKTFASGATPDDKGDIIIGKYMIECVLGNTPVRTIKGWKPIKDVKIGDEVLTDKGRYKKVNKVMNRKYNGKLISIQPHKNESFWFTEEHPILLSDGKNDVWKKVGGIEPNGINAVYLTPKFDEGLILPINFEDNCCDGIDDFDITKELSLLCGYYLAEGAATNYTVSFFFNSKEKKYINDVVYLTKKIFGLKCGIINRGSCTIVNIYSFEIMKFFVRNFGHGAYNKKIPIEILNTSLENKSELLMGLFRGDGNVSGRVISLSSVSTELIYGVRDILFELDITSSVGIGGRGEYQLRIFGNNRFKTDIFDKKPTKEIYIPSYTKKEKGIIFKNDKKIIWRIKNIIKKDVKDIDVYNLSVEVDETFVTPIGIVHNCKHWKRIYRRNIDDWWIKIVKEAEGSIPILVYKENNVDIKVKTLNGMLTWRSFLMKLKEEYGG